MPSDGFSSEPAQTFSVAPSRCTLLLHSNARCTANNGQRRAPSSMHVSEPTRSTIHPRTSLSLGPFSALSPSSIRLLLIRKCCAGEFYTQAVEAFYQEHCPEKLQDVLARLLCLLFARKIEHVVLAKNNGLAACFAVSTCVTSIMLFALHT